MQANENPLLQLSDHLAAAVEKISQSVVAVHARPRVTSSGVLWKPGVIVTADHTLRRDEDIRVTLAGGQTVAAELAGRDSGTDLAVLRLATGDLPAPVHSAATLKTGNLVLTVGRSPETGISAAMGVVSSVSGPWHTWRGGQIDQFIRLDVGLYPGTSGGAVIDVEGSLTGLATGGLSRTSPLAIPVQTIERVVEALLDKGHVARGFLGVGLQPVSLPGNLHSAQKHALIVLSVEADGPAGQAGVVIGDVLIALDGTPVEDTDDVQAFLTPQHVGKLVKASLLRGGVPVEVMIPIGERPQRRA